MVDIWHDWCTKLAQETQKCERKTDGSRCADCKTDCLCVTTADEALRVICVRGHAFWFVRAGPCKRCGCEWTDSSKAQKQLRKSDEAATITIVCLRGCRVTKSS